MHTPAIQMQRGRCASVIDSTTDCSNTHGMSETTEPNTIKFPDRHNHCHPTLAKLKLSVTALLAVAVEVSCFSQHQRSASASRIGIVGGLFYDCSEVSVLLVKFSKKVKMYSSLRVRGRVLALLSTTTNAETAPRRTPVSLETMTIKCAFILSVNPQHEHSHCSPFIPTSFIFLSTTCITAILLT
ncbi:hypothetical protein J6590_053836 [Homalodisca vitripennis]|nr:hypothetical protein J6590_053836 [Homalodisca vitripennis]